MSTPVATTESRVFLIIVIIVLIIIFSTLVANAAYYSKIDRDGGTSQVSKGSAHALVWLNSLMAIMAGGAMVYAMIRLLIHRSAINAFKQYTLSGPTGVVAYAPNAGVVSSFRPGSNVFTNTGKQVAFAPSGGFTVTDLPAVPRVSSVQMTAMPSMPVAGSLSEL